MRGLFEQNKIPDAMWLFRKLVKEKICKMDAVAEPPRISNSFIENFDSATGWMKFCLVQS
ncbi:hypothetical protein H5410_019577 [Solanum commersonii]|uniref:Uncharacterized protein n=1 Tax=Solanum commersonii TaxID=4109 RepID=A0A9J5Z8P9_SOLCO|nr:hypothetical protein H5410_019577 [Solanum commersonii]